MLNHTHINTVWNQWGSALDYWAIYEDKRSCELFHTVTDALYSVQNAPLRHLAQRHIVNMLIAANSVQITPVKFADFHHWLNK